MNLNKVIAGLAFAASALNASAAVINFDSLAAGSIAAVGSFDAQGVRFNENLLIGCNCGDLPSSLPNTALNSDSFAGNITGFFLGPVSSVNFISVFAGDNGGDIDTVTLNGFDAFNNLVDSDTFTAAVAQTLSISGAGIVRFEILESGLIAIDDFRFNPSVTPVPEPSTLALVCLALAGVGAIRRQRNG